MNKTMIPHGIASEEVKMAVAATGAGGNQLRMSSQVPLNRAANMNEEQKNTLGVAKKRKGAANKGKNVF